MTVLASLLGDFAEAIEFIFQERESVSGGVQVGGLGEFADLTFSHLLVSVVAIAAATALFVPLGLYLGHRGRGEFVAISVSNVAVVGMLTVLLAAAFDLLILGFQRLVTPWRAAARA